MPLLKTKHNICFSFYESPMGNRRIKDEISLTNYKQSFLAILLLLLTMINTESQQNAISAKTTGGVHASLT